MTPPSRAVNKPANHGAQVPCSPQICVKILPVLILRPPPPPQDEGAMTASASEGSDNAGRIQTFDLFVHDTLQAHEWCVLVRRAAEHNCKTGRGDAGQ